jgi:hypothetical protein
MIESPYVLVGRKTKINREIVMEAVFDVYVAISPVRIGRTRYRRERRPRYKPGGGRAVYGGFTSHRRTHAFEAGLGKTAAADVAAFQNQE